MATCYASLRSLLPLEFIKVMKWGMKEHIHFIWAFKKASHISHAKDSSIHSQ
ncbi:unnamed protein product [Sphenostylis stenocarpa]|uniref:Uncharacterized protein n=1 Tax=Sphenostylis stenocarpa TaxID=92480 RepID=A0AA86T718_9FABA|nr:unnamed protein product [Sphenostylis stenocarpa]